MRNDLSEVRAVGYRFSVIVPVYNVAEFLPQCMDSMLPQLDEDVQLILVDDGSTDGSGDICDQYADVAQVIHQTNRGVASARNAGLAAAQGEYLAWVDPDDWVAPDWMEKIRAGTADAPDMLLFDYCAWENGVGSERKYGREPGEQPVERVLEDIERDMTLTSALWNKVIRRELFEGIRFDESLKLLEDYDVLHRLVMRMQRIAYLPETLYEYRIRTEGLTRVRGLDVSYRSFCVAEKRRREIEATGRKCNPVGVAVQAKWFCHFYYLDGCPKAFRREFVNCRRAIWRAMPGILRDEVLPLRRKIGFALWALPGVARLYRRRVEK